MATFGNKAVKVVCGVAVKVFYTLFSLASIPSRNEWRVGGRVKHIADSQLARHSKNLAHTHITNGRNTAINI